MAKSANDYARAALALARDERRLKALRHTLRERFQTSPLGDATRFTRGLEKVYRDAWKALCEDPGDA